MSKNREEKEVAATPENPEGFVTTSRVEEKNKKENGEEKNKTATEDEEQQPKLLERDRSSDYFSLEGLSTQTGCDRQHLDVLLLKELVDNALDACNNRPVINVSFRKTITELLILTVEDNGKGIERTDLDKILDFNKFYSSKFHYKLPTRGALGNAVKCIVGLPYAIAKELNKDPIRPEVSVHSLSHKHSISLEVDEQEEKSQVSIDSEQYGVHKQGTKLSVSLFPLEENWGHKTEYSDLISAYAIFNPSASFHFSNADMILRQYDYPSICNNDPKFEGPSSIHWYSLNSFRQLVEATARATKTGERDPTITQFIKRFKGLTSDIIAATITRKLEDGHFQYVSELAGQSDFIKRLYEHMKECSNKPNADLGEIGKRNIQERIRQTYGNVRQIRYKIVRDICIKGEISTPYVLEIALAILERDSGLHIVTGINRSPCLGNPFEGYTVQWIDKGKVHDASIVGETLQKYGIDKKQNVVLVVHLICPNIIYESYGKGKINIDCFHSSLGKTLTEICRFYPSYKRKGNHKGRERQASMLMKKELIRRKQLLEGFGQMPQTERMTQQGIYYKIRSQMGGEIIVKRVSFISALRKACKEMGKGDLSYREKLGITAAERAQLYFRGQVTPISWDRIDELAEKGSDVILIEKEGVCEVLEPYAARMGIALLNSRGFATDYAKQLLQLSQKLRGNIFLLTDFDASGLLIASKILEGRIPRIGVDLMMVEELGLTRRDLEEKYDTEDTKAPKRHLMGLPEEMQMEVKDTRVEIDAVLAAVGPEKFWNYIEKSMLEIAPARNMNRSVDLTIPIPTEINESIQAITSFIQSKGIEKQNGFKRILGDWYGGFIYVDHKENNLKSQIVEEIRKNDSVQELAKQLKSLSDAIPKNS